MGRIGRLLFRRLINHPDIELVAVNDIIDPANLLYLLKYDTLYGPFSGTLAQQGNQFVAGDRKVQALQFGHPAEFSWSDHGIDLVIECSGKFTSRNGAEQHLAGGAKKVLLSTTGSTDIPLMIYGFNHHRVTPDTTIVSPGGCMTNCATHVLYLLNSIGIETAHIHILHSYTSRQELVDTAHNQWRRGRAAAESIIPVEIDLAMSLQRLLPLENRIAALSTRVPVTNGAMADITVQLKSEASRDQINALFSKAATGDYKGIISYTEDQVVSADIKGNTHSCVIDGTLTSVVGRQVKIIAWFDNEFGYTSRMIDWLQYIRQLS